MGAYMSQPTPLSFEDVLSVLQSLPSEAWSFSYVGSIRQLFHQDHPLFPFCSLTAACFHTTGTFYYLIEPRKAGKTMGVDPAAVEAMIAANDGRMPDAWQRLNEALKHISARRTL
jgi:hypothetical protein